MSIILSVLGIDSNITFLKDQMNLYHVGDKTPWATVVIKDGKAVLKVNAGEVYSNACHLNLGRYER